MTDKVLIRADASVQIGTGHLMRTRTLAEALRARGAEVAFVCREHPGNMIVALRQDGFDVRALPVADAPPDAEDEYARWLGVSQEVDARQTLEAAGQGRWDWLIVDHYGLDARWETALRPHVGRIMVIDDLANRPHDCDLLLDQNLVDGFSTRYDALLPATCRQLVGPRYVMLGPDYARSHKLARQRKPPIGRVALFFGGADHCNLTSMALGGLSRLPAGKVALDIVLGLNNANAANICKQALTRPNTSVHFALPSLAPIWQSADLAIASGGVATWERICCKLPSLVITTGENQRAPTAAAARAGCLLDLGPHENVSASDIEGAVAIMINTPDQYTSLSASCADLVDGLGVSRVTGALFE